MKEKNRSQQVISDSNLGLTIWRYYLSVHTHSIMNVIYKCVQIHEIVAICFMSCALQRKSFVFWPESLIVQKYWSLLKAVIRRTLFHSRSKQGFDSTTSKATGRLGWHNVFWLCLLIVAYLRYVQLKPGHVKRQELRQPRSLAQLLWSPLGWKPLQGGLIITDCRRRNIQIWKIIEEHRCSKQKKGHLGWCEGETESKKTPKSFSTEGTDEKCREHICSLTRRWVKPLFF